MKIEVNKIYNIDCIDGMNKMIEQGVFCDIILTSPPYNTGRNSGSVEKNFRRYDFYEELHDNEEYCKWTVQLFELYDKVLKENGVVLYNLSYGTENTTCMSLAVAEIIKNTQFTLADIIVWEKNCAFPNNENKLTRICGFVYVFCRKTEFSTFNCNKKVVSERSTGQKMYECIYNKVKAKNNDETCMLNRATFSTELVYKLLNIYSKEGDIVLDNFMGTGTTAIGAIKCGRKYIGFELSKEQAEYSKERIKKHQSQVSIFDL